LSLAVNPDLTAAGVLYAGVGVTAISLAIPIIALGIIIIVIVPGGTYDTNDVYILVATEKPSHHPSPCLDLPMITRAVFPFSIAKNNSSTATNGA
jgi:hypothetical protein